MRFFSFFAMAGLAACTASDVQPSEPLEAVSSAAVWAFDDHVADLRERSCPDGVSYQKAEELSLQIIEAERGPKSAREINLEGLTLAGAWHLKSENSEFGGLSGLDVLRSGALLSITDDGIFVWIGIDPETGAPDGLGAIAYMRNADGDIFPSKRSADSEDLAFRDGLALVSFEQDHRIEAYDLESCGAAARAARVVKLDKVVDGNVLSDNRGPEALALNEQTLTVGFEVYGSGGSPMGEVRVDGTLEDFRRTEQPLLYMLTGMDRDGETSAKVFRAYDPLRGSRAILRVHSGETLLAKAAWKKPLPVDNFEAVAIGENAAGGTRIWVLSDDNFNLDQRTLLLAFDLED